MKIVKRLMEFLKKKPPGGAPLVIIRQDTENAHVKEYKSIEEAIADLENDPNVPADKIEKLKSSVKQLKNRTSIKIRNGEIVK